MGTATTPGSLSDTLELRRALGHFATGVTVVSYTADPAGEFRGTTVNSFTSVSLEPPLVLVSVGRQTRAAAALRPGRAFAVNVLHHGQRDLAVRFAGGPGTRVDWEVRAGVPHLAGCAAYFRCAAQDVHGAGDHLLVVAAVEGFSTPQAAAHGHPPLIFHQGTFKRLANIDQHSNDQHSEKE
jgi:flavin reductase (DIM6/NTAB) family NADH-FMN oxidoreductase RutF